MGHGFLDSVLRPRLLTELLPAVQPSPAPAFAPSELTTTVATIGVHARDSGVDVNPLYMGCHSDSGFVHQVRGWSSQMLFGESFETPPDDVQEGQSSRAWHEGNELFVNASFSPLVNDTVAPAMHGAEAIRIEFHGFRQPESVFGELPTVESPTAPASYLPVAALRNRGLGNEGLYFEAGKPYEGYFFARCAPNPEQAIKPSPDPEFAFFNPPPSHTMTVRLEDYVSAANPSVLADWSTELNCTGNWEKYSFELTPAAGTSCETIAPGSDPKVHCTKPTAEAGSACVRCGGQFSIGLASYGTVDLDYVVLQPGSWGRYKNLGVRQATVDMLQQMGVTAVRLGGSFVSVTGPNKLDPSPNGPYHITTPASDVSGEYYSWLKWTGPPWKRPSVGASWLNDAKGSKKQDYSLIGPWGPFEHIELCNEMGIVPILTTT